jgi:hypothetical protein
MIRISDNRGDSWLEAGLAAQTIPIRNGSVLADPPAASPLESPTTIGYHPEQAGHQHTDWARSRGSSGWGQCRRKEHGRGANVIA